MERWRVGPADAVHASRQGALGAVIGAIGTPAFAAAALAAVHPMMRAGSWSVYRLWPDREPQMHLSAAHGVPDTTRDCFGVYRAGLYRRDRSFDSVRSAREHGATEVLRLRADEVANPDHREAIYRRHGLAARLSLARLDDDGSLLAVNLYRHGHDGPFGDVEVAHLADIGPLLVASIARHVASAGAGDTAPVPPRQRLRRCCPALTDRELDVCERLLSGMTYDGIAADIGLSVATVKTYRARAFDRLGIHFRSELFRCVDERPRS